MSWFCDFTCRVISLAPLHCSGSTGHVAKHAKLTHRAVVMNWWAIGAWEVPSRKILRVQLFHLWRPSIGFEGLFWGKLVCSYEHFRLWLPWRNCDEISAGWLSRFLFAAVCLLNKWPWSRQVWISILENQCIITNASSDHFLILVNLKT